MSTESDPPMGPDQFVHEVESILEEHKCLHDICVEMLGMCGESEELEDLVEEAEKKKGQVALLEEKERKIAPARQHWRNHKEEYPPDVSGRIEAMNRETLDLLKKIEKIEEESRDILVKNKSALGDELAMIFQGKGMLTSYNEPSGPKFFDRMG